MSARFFLIDGHAYTYQAFYGRSGLRTLDGRPVGAAYAFAQLLHRIREEERPEYLAVAFDAEGPTFRHDRFPAYKANRPAMPEELAAQFEEIEALIAAHRIPIFRLPGYEADDLMATLARQASAAGIETYLVSRDKDLEQLLVDPGIRLLDPTTGEVLDSAGVRARRGFGPERVVDYLSLVGDPTDNVPGVPGVGPKTAAAILAHHEDFEGIFRTPWEGLRPSIRARLLEGREAARRARSLVELAVDAPVRFDPGACRVREPDAEALRSLYERLGFRRLLASTPRVVVEAEPGRYRTIATGEDLAELVGALERSGGFAFDTELTGLDPFDDELVGLSFSLRPGEGSYVPIRSPAGEPRLPEALVLERLRPVLEDPAIPKTGQNVKFDALACWIRGVRASGFVFDTMIASYLLAPDRRGHSLDALALEYLEYRGTPIESLIGPRGRAQGTLAEVPVERVTRYACEDADLAGRLRPILERRLSEESLDRLFREVEMPLVEVLTAMEAEGIAIDRGRLSAMAEDLRREVGRLEAEIQRLAGAPVNPSSPKQLAEILYGRLGLPKGRRTKTGRSTDADSLEELRGLHPIVEAILEYRSLSKLLSTYVEALPGLAKRRTGRLHTTFHQTSTATGRLSSSDPNLQNIPIKSELGRRIRAAFVARDPEHALISADYSQIELRILAHLSGDEALGRAFREGRDIHAEVAQALYGVPAAQVDAQMRRFAKTINFSIVYGKTPFGLSRDLGIPRAEAEAFIAQYFARYGGVREFVDRTVVEAEAEGAVRTILGRRRPIPEIRSRNLRQREIARRVAVNTVVQGSAADLIKVAMNNLYTEFRRGSSPARILLQIHDELLVEAPLGSVEAERERVRAEMAGALELRVPIEVKTAVGSNWLEGT